MRQTFFVCVLASALSIPGLATAQEPGDVVRFTTKNQPPAEVYTTGTIADMTADSLLVNADPSGQPRALARSDLLELWIWRVGWKQGEAKKIAIGAAAMGLWYMMLSRAKHNSNRWKWTLTGAGFGALAGAAGGRMHGWWEPVQLDARRSPGSL